MLGIWKALDVALLGYISSMFSVSNLVGAVLSRVNGPAPSEELIGAVHIWKGLGKNVMEPPEEMRCKQRAWDSPLLEI